MSPSSSIGRLLSSTDRICYARLPRDLMRNAPHLHMLSLPRRQPHSLSHHRRDWERSSIACGDVWRYQVHVIHPWNLCFSTPEDIPHRQYVFPSKFAGGRASLFLPHSNPTTAPALPSRWHISVEAHWLKLCKLPPSRFSATSLA